MQFLKLLLLKEMLKVFLLSASIMAKEYRDGLMAEVALKYPGYDFEKM